MTAKEILEKWLKYTKYDENQKTFNLLSANYYLHRCTEQMQKVMQFDPTGTLAVLFAKQRFLALCKEAKVSLYELFTTPEMIQEDREMWDIFTGEDVKAVESALLDSIDALVRQVVPTKMLGERNLDEERDSLLDSIESVVEELEKCHEDVFLKGTGPIQKISHFSTHIHVFDTMAACLTSMEASAADGLYLCFIRCGNTGDCYFTFMLKSNGNLISINERINETFPGQHKGSRNGRWSESKKYNLFPYRFIMDESNFDYLGYSHTQVIDEEKLAFFKLTARAYMPLILAMVCIVTKYTGMDVSDRPLKYIDSLLKWNLELPSPACTALAIQNDSAIAGNHSKYDRCTITSETVLNGTLHDKYSWKNIEKEYLKNGAPHADFGNKETLFVELYGDGFKLDTDQLLVTDPHLRLPGITPGNTDKTMPNNEFIGTADGLDLIAYQQGRTQLAAYLRKRIFEEYLAFGGKEAIEKWFASAIETNKDHLIDLCAEKYVAVKTNGDSNSFRASWNNGSEKFPYLDFGEEKEYAEHCFSGTVHPFNREYKKDQYGRERREKPLCPNTGALCSIEFVFRPRNWEEMQKLFGDIPKPLVGWDANGHHRHGNSFLNVTDPVEDVGTVFEGREQDRNPLFSSKWWEKEDGKYSKPQTSFNFAIAFSKRGWAQELKSRGIDTEAIKLPVPKGKGTCTITY